MYYVLSKLLWYAAAPSNVMAGLVVAGTALLWMGSFKVARRLLTLGALLFVAFGLLPGARLLLAPLEERFPAWKDDGQPIAAIVVLGGAIETRLSEKRGQLGLNDFAERMTAMGDLARRYPTVPVIFTGGAGSFGNGDVSEAEVVRTHIAEFGLPPGRVQFEDRSRNTLENARFTRPMLDLKRGDRVLLVTSAFHMPRSVGLFRAEGIDVVACPVDYQESGPEDLWRLSGSISGALTRTDIAVREYIGLVAARVLGHSRELFPGP